MDSEMFLRAMPSVIDKYSSMEVDDSEGEELEYYIENCPLTKFSKSSQSVPSYIMDSITPKFVFRKNTDPSSGKCKHSNPTAKRQRSPRAHDFDIRRSKRVPEPIVGHRNTLSNHLDGKFLNESHHRRTHSLSPQRVIPFEVFERNYQAHIRSHSVYPSRKISYADPQALHISDNTHGSLLGPDVGSEQRKCNLATVAPFELLERNYQRMERQHSLPSFLDSGRRTESPNGIEKTLTISSQKVFDLSRIVPDWFTPPRASTVRLSRSVLERHSLSSCTPLGKTCSPDRRLLSWIRSQLTP